MGVIDELTQIVGGEHVLIDPDLTAGYTTDWTGRFVGAARAVVRPGSTEEVAAVVATCARHGCPLVPQGGNTGLAGGAVPDAQAVVLSLRRLDELGPVDAEGMTVRAGAGVTVAALQQAAESAGLMFGVDFASRDTATVGGAIATNAGGVHVLRYGSMRAQVRGIEAVLADGRVLRWLPGLVKDNVGYHLPSLLTGSEGTLAVVTAARLRLIPRPAQKTVALLGLADLGAALRTLSRLRGLEGLQAVELVFDAGVELVCAVTGQSRPLPARHPVYLLVEHAGARDGVEILAGVLGDDPDVADAAVAVDERDAARLWSYREAHTDAISTLGVPHKLDVSLPHDALAAFTDQVVDAVAAVAPQAQVFLFGHLGDGNVHVNVAGADPGDERIDAAVLELVAAHGGSISAEHGVGRQKLRWIELTRSSEALEVMAAIKRALDPRGLLNPGVLLPPTLLGEPEGA